MKLTVNGVRFPWPASGLKIEIEVQPGENGEEQAGPVNVVVRGGILRIRLQEGAGAITVRAEEMSALIAWDRPIAYDRALGGPLAGIYGRELSAEETSGDTVTVDPQ